MKTSSGLFFGALVVGVVALVLWTSLDFQECIKSYGENDRGAEHLKKSISVFINSFPTYRHCIGAYVTDKNAVITALGTLVIAVFTTVLGIFTVSLARSTRVAANAAAEGAQTEIALRRPRLMVSAIIASENVTKIGFAVNYGIENFGETPAILQQTSIQAAILPDLPNHPTYENPRIWRDRLIYGKTGIPPAEGLRCSTPPENGNIILDEQGMEKTHLYFFGYFVFLDVFEKLRRTGFCYEVDTMRGGMVRAGGRAYNYDTEIDQ